MEKRGLGRDSVWRYGERRGAMCVNCMHVYQNVLARERETERGGAYSENWRSKFIIVMAFSGIHFPVVCWQLVVSAYHPPHPLPPPPCVIDGTGLQPNRPGYTLQHWTHMCTCTHEHTDFYLLSIFCDQISWAGHSSYSLQLPLSQRHSSPHSYDLWLTLFGCQSKICSWKTKK